MYRRPARDRNYEFWGDQTFYGENPPQAAVLSWLNKKQVGDIKLRSTDAAGREVREISGDVLTNSNEAGHSDPRAGILRVQPAPPLPQPAGRGGAPATAPVAQGQGGQSQPEGRSRPRGSRRRRHPARSGPAVRRRPRRGGGFGFGPNTAGPLVLPGNYKSN